MLETYDYSQLDPATKAYLRDVRAMKGYGTPGFFFGVGYSRPLWAFLFGAFILGFFLWIASTSNKAPWAVAALQTAAILMGGWLILYAFRRWLANTETFAGWFFYFDPAHAFIGEGEKIRVAALPSDTEIQPIGDSVRFMTQHDGFTVKLPTRAAAGMVADYYAAVDWVLAKQDGPWAGIPLVEVGGVAKYLAEEDQEPPSIQDAGLKLDSLPEQVTAVRKPKSGMLGYLAVIGVGVVLFGLFSAVNPGLQDDRNFAAAKGKADNPVDSDHLGAQGYRDYLLNERNTKHRDDATRLLAELYDKPINRVKAAASDPVLRDGMVALLESLRGPDSPAVSIEVTDKSTGMPAGGPMSDGLRSMISDGIAKACGKDMIVFVAKPKDVPDAHAHLDVKYATVPGQFGSAGSVDWWVELRLKPEDEKPIATQKGRATVLRNGLPVGFPNIGGFTNPMEDPTLPSAVSNEVTEAVYKDVMMKMVGSAPEKAKVVWEGD
jgi:hypothetical protein